MRYATIILLLLGLAQSLAAQGPPKVTLDQLEQRTAAGADTLYIINLWATWCRPCVEEMPYFDAVSKEYAAQPVKVLFVSLDMASEYEKRLPAFLKKRDFHAQVLYLDEPKIQTKIDLVSPAWSGAIPATLFVQKGKDLRKFHEGDYTLESLRTQVQSLTQ